jgi:hypothetical protein
MLKASFGGHMLDPPSLSTCRQRGSHFETVTLQLRQKIAGKTLKPELYGGSVTERIIHNLPDLQRILGADLQHRQVTGIGSDRNCEQMLLSELVLRDLDPANPNIPLRTERDFHTTITKYAPASVAVFVSSIPARGGKPASMHARLTTSTDSTALLEVISQLYEDNSLLCRLPIIRQDAHKGPYRALVGTPLIHLNPAPLDVVTHDEYKLVVTPHIICPDLPGLPVDIQAIHILREFQSQVLTSHFTSTGGIPADYLPIAHAYASLEFDELRRVAGDGQQLSIRLSSAVAAEALEKLSHVDICVGHHRLYLSITGAPFAGIDYGGLLRVKRPYYLEPKGALTLIQTVVNATRQFHQTQCATLTSAAMMAMAKEYTPMLRAKHGASLIPATELTEANVLDVLHTPRGLLLSGQSVAANATLLKDNKRSGGIGIVINWADRHSQLLPLLAVEHSRPKVGMDPVYIALHKSGELLGQDAPFTWIGKKNPKNCDLASTVAVAVHAGITLAQVDTLRTQHHVAFTSHLGRTLVQLLKTPPTPALPYKGACSNPLPGP